MLADLPAKVVRAILKIDKETDTDLQVGHFPLEHAGKAVIVKCCDQGKLR